MVRGVWQCFDSKWYGARVTYNNVRTKLGLAGDNSISVRRCFLINNVSFEVREVLSARPPGGRRTLSDF